ncbi:MAG: CAP domain-containing protein [Terriglobales bacterium]
MRVRTRVAATPAAVILIGLTIFCGVAHAQSATVRAERELFAAVNQARRSQGLAVLQWDESLAEAARRHAAVMAEHREAQHQFEGEASLSVRVKRAGAHFSWLSENVTQGPSTEFINSQFLSSPKHRANILDTDMNSAGIGVAERDGQLFAVEDFAQIAQ